MQKDNIIICCVPTKGMEFVISIARTPPEYLTIHYDIVCYVAKYPDIETYLIIVDFVCPTAPAPGATCTKYL